MRWSEIVTEGWLTEDPVSQEGTMWLGYHRTKPENLEQIQSNGFVVADPDAQAYGPGAYACLDWKSITDGPVSSWGSTVLKVKINLHGCLVLDNTLAKQIYGEKSSLEDQFKMFGLPLKELPELRAQVSEDYDDDEDDYYDDEDEDEDDLRYDDEDEDEDVDPNAGTYSAMARRAAILFYDSNKIKGLVYNCPNDGNAVVMWNPKDMIPFAYAEDVKPMADLSAVSWMKLSSVPIGKGSNSQPPKYSKSRDGNTSEKMSDRKKTPLNSHEMLHYLKKYSLGLRDIQNMGFTIDNEFADKLWKTPGIAGMLKGDLLKASLGSPSNSDLISAIAGDKSGSIIEILAHRGPISQQMLDAAVKSKVAGIAYTNLEGYARKNGLKFDLDQARTATPRLS